MSGTESPKVEKLITQFDGCTVEEGTDALKSPKGGSSPTPIVSSPGAKRLSSPSASPKAGSPKNGANAKSPSVGSPTTRVKIQDPKSPSKVQADGSPDAVFESKDDESKKSGDEKDATSEQSKERTRSRTGSYRNARYAGLSTPPFRDNYFKHGEKPETDTAIEALVDSAKVVADTQHDRPGFFVGRTRRQSEKSTDGAKKDGGEGDDNKRNRRPANRRNRRPPPPEQYIDYQPRGYRGGQGFFRQTSYQPQPTYYQDFNYYQGQPFQQRGNRGMQRGFSYPGPPNFGGQYVEPQYPPRQFRKQRNQAPQNQQPSQRHNSNSFYDNFGGDQVQQQGNKNKNKRRRSRTSSKRDRTASTASSTKQVSPTTSNSEARQVAIDVKSS